MSSRLARWPPEAEDAIGSIVEGLCLLCQVPARPARLPLLPVLSRHFRTGPHRLQLGSCAEHSTECQHWRAMWGRAT